MLINFNHLKTFSNAFLQKMKGFRGNWNQNDPTADDYIKNRTHYVDNDGNVHKLDKKFIDMPDGIVTEDSLSDILNNNLAPVAFTNNYNDLSNKPTIYTDVVRYNNSQSLTTSQKRIAKSNINAVGYDTQTLTEAQKTQARVNIGASDFSGNYNDLTEKPCYDLPTYYETHASNSTGSWIDWTISSSSGISPKYRNVTLPRINLGETYRITIYSSSGVQTYSTECVAKLGYGNNSDDQNSMLGNSTLWFGVGENTGEPVLIYWHDDTSENVNIFIDFGVITGGVSRIDIHKRVDTLKQLDEKFIPDSVKYGNTEVTNEFSWGCDIENRDVLDAGGSKYYKISDKNFDAADIISSEITRRHGSAGESSGDFGPGWYQGTQIFVCDEAGNYNVQSTTFHAPSPGVYFYYYHNSDSGIQNGPISANITYKARSIPSDVVGVVRTINGEAPDIDGNVAVEVGSDITVDDTLTIEGAAADAKVTGEKITYLQDQIDVGADWNANEGEAGYVKNRTHYEVVETVNEPLNITWDGTIEGLVCVNDEYSKVSYYKVSDLVFTDEEIMLMAITISTEPESPMPISVMWDEALAHGMITEDCVNLGAVAFVRTPNASLNGTTFSDVGIYFMNMPGVGYISSLTTTEPIEHTAIVVHKLDAKYLPFDSTEKQVYNEVVVVNTTGYVESAHDDLNSSYALNLKEGDVVTISITCGDDVLNTQGTIGEFVHSINGYRASVILDDSALNDAVSVYYINYYPGDSGDAWRICFTDSIDASYTIVITANILVSKHLVIDKKHLPDDVGGLFKVNVYYDEANSVWVSDKTYDEINAAEQAKMPIVGTFTDKDGRVFTLIGCDESTETCFLSAFSVLDRSSPVIYRIVITGDGDVSVYELALTATATALT